MEPAEATGVSPTALPVFVDETGRRRTLARRVGRIVVIGFVGYLTLLIAGFARDPHVGPLTLPTFGLPGLTAPPLPSLGQASPRSAGSETVVAAGDGATRPADASGRTGSSAGRANHGVSASPAPGSGPEPGPGANGPGGSIPPPAATTTGSPAAGPGTVSTSPPTTAVPATTTTTGHGSKSPSTTTTTSSTSTTTTTTVPAPGSAGASAKGPDGSGPPGQLRRPTTTTTTTGPSAQG